MRVWCRLPAAGQQHLLEALRGFDRALAGGTFKAQWNVCYGLGALLRVPAAAAALEACNELPALLLRVAGIASASPNFKVGRRRRLVELCRKCCVFFGSVLAKPALP